MKIFVIQINVWSLSTIRNLYYIICLWIVWTPLYLIPGSTTAKKQNQNSHTNRSTKTPKRSEERAPEGKEQSKLSKQHKRRGHHEPRSKGLYSHKIHRHEQIT